MNAKAPVWPKHPGANKGQEEPQADKGDVVWPQVRTPEPPKKTAPQPKAAPEQSPANTGIVWPQSTKKNEQPATKPEAPRVEATRAIPATRKKPEISTAIPAAKQASAPQASAPQQAPAQKAPAAQPKQPVKAQSRPHSGEVAAYARGLYKCYGEGDAAVIALGGVDIDFYRGQFTAIMGPSGSGKSTLMHCMAGLDAASAGNVFIGDTDLSKLDNKATTALRRDRLGFIFQSFNLVPTLTAAENITLPLDIAGTQVDQVWYEEIVTRLGLKDRLEHRPAELSGGQQQRVACARALVSRPDIVFGDEPTGNLDSNSSAEVLSILRSSVDKDGQTVVIVTHDARAASYADRVVFLADGQLVNEVLNPDMDRILETMRGIEG